MNSDYTSAGHSPDLTDLAASFGTLRSYHIGDLPSLGMKGAPKKFRGEARDLQAFLDQFERITDARNFTGEQKCSIVKEYCSGHVADTILGLKGYYTKDWELLKKQLLKTYDVDSVATRYSIKDLHLLVTHRSQETRKMLTSLHEWRKFEQRFYRIAGTLLQRKKITEKEYATYYWLSIPERIRTNLEVHIRSKLPDHDMSTPFPVDDIQEAIEDYLHRDRFDTTQLLFQTDKDSDTEALESSDDSDDESDAEFKSKVRKMIKQKKAAQQDIGPKPSSKQTSPKLKGSQPQKVKEPSSKPNAEVEELIAQMGRMSLNDPQYRLNYYRAVKLDPLVASILTKPQTTGPDRITPPTIMTRPPPRTAPVIQQPPIVSRAPLVMNSNVGAAPGPVPPWRNPIRPIQGCFGCGDIGHRISECLQVQQWIDSGYVLTDGRSFFDQSRRRIPRGDPSVPWVDVFKNFLGPLSNPVTGSMQEAHYLKISSESDDDDASSEEFIAAQYETRSKGPASQERTRNSQQHSTSQRTPVISPRTPPKRPPPRNIQPKPVDAIPSRFDPAREDVIMEDAPIQPQQLTPPRPFKPAVRQVNPAATGGEISKNTSTPRQSALSGQVPPITVVNKLLNTPVTMSVGEVLGTSKEVAAKLNDLLKYRQAKTLTDTQPAEANLVSKAKASLIRVPMSCNGTNIEFVLDTGSEINVLSYDTWKNLRIPIDKTKGGRIKDANGGIGHLLGRVDNVPLEVGHIRTIGDFYVSKNAPFQGLLGRPWHSDNEIVIANGKEVTKIGFEPDETGSPTSELIVVPPPEKRAAFVSPYDRYEEAEEAQVELTSVLIASLPSEEDLSSQEDAVSGLSELSDTDEEDGTDLGKSVLIGDMSFPMQGDESEISLSDDTDSTEQPASVSPFTLDQTTDSQLVNVTINGYAVSAVLDFGNEQCALSSDMPDILEIATIWEPQGDIEIFGRKHQIVGRSAASVEVTDLQETAFEGYRFTVVRARGFVSLGRSWLREQGFTFDYGTIGFSILDDKQRHRPPGYSDTYIEDSMIVAKILIEGQQVNTAFDFFAFENFISLECCRRLHLSVNRTPSDCIKNYGNWPMEFYGRTLPLTVTYGPTLRIALPTQFYVMEHLDCDAIIGRIWLEQNQLGIFISALARMLPIPAPTPPGTPPSASIYALTHFEEEEEEGQVTDEMDLFKSYEQDRYFPGPYQRGLTRYRLSPEIAPAQIILHLVVDGTWQPVIVDPFLPFNIIGPSVWKKWDRPIETTSMNKLYIASRPSYTICGKAKGVIVSFGSTLLDTQVECLLADFTDHRVILGRQWLEENSLTLHPGIEGQYRGIAVPSGLTIGEAHPTGESPTYRHKNGRRNAIFIEILINKRRFRAQLDVEAPGNSVNIGFREELGLPYTTISTGQHSEHGQTVYLGTIPQVEVTFGRTWNTVKVDFEEKGPGGPGILLGRPWLEQIGEFAAGKESYTYYHLGIPREVGTLEDTSLPASTLSYATDDIGNHAQDIDTEMGSSDDGDPTSGPEPDPSDALPKEHEIILDEYSQQLRGKGTVAPFLEGFFNPDGSAPKLGPMQIEASDGFTISDNTLLGVTGKHLYLRNCQIKFEDRPAWCGPALIQIYPPVRTVEHAREIVRDSLGVTPASGIVAAVKWNGEPPPGIQEKKELPTSPAEVQIAGREPWNLPVVDPLSLRTSTIRPAISIIARIRTRGISFLIDSGSECNIIHSSLWNLLVDEFRFTDSPMPSLYAPGTCSVSGVNGQSLSVRGIAYGVRVYVGQLVTVANFCIVENSSLLAVLGRPWQYDNYVLLGRFAESSFLRIHEPITKRTYEVLFSEPSSATIVADIKIPYVNSATAELDATQDSKNKDDITQPEILDDNYGWGELPTEIPWDSIPVGSQSPSPTEIWENSQPSIGMNEQEYDNYCNWISNVKHFADNPPKNAKEAETFSYLLLDIIQHTPGTKEQATSTIVASVTASSGHDVKEPGLPHRQDEPRFQDIPANVKVDDNLEELPYMLGTIPPWTPEEPNLTMEEVQALRNLHGRMRGNLALPNFGYTAIAQAHYSTADIPGEARKIFPHALNVSHITAYEYQSENLSQKRPSAFLTMGNVTFNGRRYFCTGIMEVKREYQDPEELPAEKELWSPYRRYTSHIFPTFIGPNRFANEPEMETEEVEKLRRLLISHFIQKYAPTPTSDTLGAAFLVSRERFKEREFLDNLPGHYHQIDPEELPITEVTLWEYHSDLQIHQMPSAYLMMFKSQKFDREYIGTGILELRRMTLQPYQGQEFDSRQTDEEDPQGYEVASPVPPRVPRLRRITQRIGQTARNFAHGIASTLKA